MLTLGLGFRPGVLVVVHRGQVVGLHVLTVLGPAADVCAVGGAHPVVGRIAPQGAGVNRERWLIVVGHLDQLKGWLFALDVAAFCHTCNKLNSTTSNIHHRVVFSTRAAFPVCVAQAAAQDQRPA